MTTLDEIIRPSLSTLAANPDFMSVLSTYITDTEDIPAYQVAPQLFVIAIPSTEFTPQDLHDREVEFTEDDQPLSVLATVQVTADGADVAFTAVTALPAFAVVGTLENGALMPATDLLNPSPESYAKHSQVQSSVEDEARAMLAAIFGEATIEALEDDQA